MKSPLLAQQFRTNKKGIDYFVGDIHGCFDELRKVLKEKEFVKSRDRLFSCGDLVDRGPDSIQFLKWINKPWFHAVKGNHDHMAERFPSGLMSTENYVTNGGKWMVELKSGEQSIVAKAMSTLPYMIEIESAFGNIGVVHAEVPYDDWENAKNNLHRKAVKDYLMWSRDKLAVWNKDGSRNTRIDTQVDNIDLVVVGHTPQKMPRRHGNVVYIDTGAGKTGNITVHSAKELFSL